MARRFAHAAAGLPLARNVAKIPANTWWASGKKNHAYPTSRKKPAES